MKLRKIKIFGFWLLGTLGIYLLLSAVIMYFYGVPAVEIPEYLPMVAEELLFNPVGLLALIMPYLLYRLTRHLYTSYNNHGSRVFFKKFALLVLFPIITIFAFSRFSKHYTQSEDYDYEWNYAIENSKDTVVNRYALDSKQRGMHLFWRRSIADEQIQQLLKNNIEWLTFVPFADQQDYDSHQIGRRKSDYSTWSRRDSFYMRIVPELKAKGFRFMMKPHIWMSNPSSGKWRAQISHKNDVDWLKWSDNYEKLILHYARLSELLEIEMFCIGTELHMTVKEHPGFWKALITKVRKIYKGKITYAANWNEEVYDVPFWQGLDFIGIQAYYPLTNKKDPELKDLLKGWKSHIKSIEKLHKKYNKPILFTEIGYKSTVDAAIEPWEWVGGFSNVYKKVSNRTQANCYEAFFKTFWDKDWFAGAHIWEWQAGHDPDSRYGRANFTPQQKPAENIMAKWFGSTTHQ